MQKQYRSPSAAEFASVQAGVAGMVSVCCCCRMHLDEDACGHSLLFSRR